jgi:hypothetical protein
MEKQAAKTLFTACCVLVGLRAIALVIKFFYDAVPNSEPAATAF